jgi:hypothetical protein
MANHKSRERDRLIIDARGGQETRASVCRSLRWLPTLLGALVLLSACAADTSADNSAQPRKFRCDRNGTYEERMACKT